ncbi:Spc98 family-domain-containing protein [Fusarium acuminatum]|uniref:Spindle pole body component n=1 Tax=Fusarium acuminatum TaxID=5515 RepID=A0ABZ2WN15_9HYPO
MTEPQEDPAAVFAIPDFWKPSKWLHQFDHDPNARDPFFSPGLTNDIDSDLVQLGEVSVQKSGFFKLPSQFGPQSEPEPESETTVSINDGPVPVESVDGAESEDDIWTNTDRPAEKVPEHKTWDGFIAGTAAGQQPPLITEAGATVYDALLGWSVDPLELKSSEVPVVDIKAYFASLLALALGQESVFFSRQEKGRSFVPAIPSMRVTGYSKDVLRGLEKQCHRCGSMLLELRSFVNTTYAKRTSKCGVALAGAIDQILKDVQRHVALHGQTPRLSSKFRKNYGDEHVLSLVFHEAYSVDYGEEQLRGIMREVLQRTSSPWIEFLEEWIGTRQEEGIPLTKANVGASKGFIKVDTEKYTDDFGHEVEDIDFRLDETKMPHFMPYDIAKSIFETGKNLRFIRECHPEHPLASAHIINATNPPKVGWLYDWDAIGDLEKRVIKYHDDLLQAISDCSPTKQVSQKGDSNQSMDAGKITPPHEDGTSEMAFMSALTARMDEPLTVDASIEDALSRILRERLTQSAARKLKPPTSGFDFTPHPSLLPVLSFGGIASAQSEVVNQESLRLLFNNHDLRGHLKMHRDFHLFGSGITTRWSDPEDISYRFTREALHFVSGITSFFMDAGVAIPWEAFEAKLDKVQADLKSPSHIRNTPDKVESPDRLREFHSRVLDRIMLSLFLRKRQQPVLKLLDEIFSTVLEYAKFSRIKALGKDQTTTPEETQELRRLYRNFKQRVQIFMTVCRALTEKSRSTSNKVSDDLGLKQEGIGEDHMVAQLLMKLDMNDYYTKH